MHWAAEMGLRLLIERQASSITHGPVSDPPSSSSSSTTSSSTTSSSIGGSSSSGGGSSKGSSRWSPWIQSLPTEIQSSLSATAQQLTLLQDPGLAEEVVAMQACMEDCYMVSHFNIRKHFKDGVKRCIMLRTATLTISITYCYRTAVVTACQAVTVGRYNNMQGRRTERCLLRRCKTGILAVA